MNGDRWIFRKAIEARLGSFPNARPGVLSPEGELLAEVASKAMTTRQADRFQTSLGRAIGHVVGSYRSGAVENPNLTRHSGKAARWHITSESGEPLADVYFGIQADAGKVARLIANLRREPVRVYDNAGQPAHLSAHRGAGSYSPNPNARRPNARKPSMLEAGYEFVRNDGRGAIIVSEIVSGGLERWVANKGHASFGFHYRGTDWEFASSNVDNPALPFDAWMRAVDAAVEAKAGCSVHDLADCPFADWYEDRVTPKSAAARAIRSQRENPRGRSSLAWKFTGRGQGGRKVIVTVERLPIPGTPMQGSSSGGFGQLHYATTSAGPGVGIVLVTGKGLEGWAVPPGPSYDKEFALGELRRMRQNPREVSYGGGRAGEYVPDHPERTSYRGSTGSINSSTWGDVYFKTWPSRAAMLKAIEMQSKREPRAGDLRDYMASRYPAALAALGRTPNPSRRKSLVKKSDRDIFVRQAESQGRMSATVFGVPIMVTQGTAGWHYHHPDRGIVGPFSTAGQAFDEAYQAGRVPNPKGRKAAPRKETFRETEARYEDWISRAAENWASIANRRSMSGIFGRLYLYVRPSTATQDGALYWLTEDETPDPLWQLATAEGFGSNLTQAQVRAKVWDVARRLPLYAYGSVSNPRAILPCGKRRHNPGCPCDPRCCGATGDVCECRCGGAYHKSGGGGNLHLTHRNPRGGKIAVGDRVQYRAAFLRSTGMYTGDVPRAKGIVTALTPFGGAGNALATIAWDIPGIPERVLTPNLKRIGEYEPNPRELSRVRQHGTRVTATGTPAARMAALRQIVAESQYAKIDGTMVDLYTASAIVQIYDALNDANRAKFASFPVGMMAKVAFKLMQPKANPRARTWIVIDAAGRQFWQGEATDEGEALFMAERSAAGQADPPDPWMALQANPSYRLSGTVEEIPDAPPVARRGPGRPRKVRIAPVELAAELDPVPFEVPAEAPGRELQAGDRVTVPYSGRASYFGRAAKHTRESGIFEGYTYENDQRLAFVRVIRGHTVETHAFPVDQVRLHGKSFAEQAAGRRAGRPAKLARLTWKAHGSLAKAEAMLEKATSEHAATEALAMELYPQHEAQPGRPRGRTEAASRDYLNARAKLRRLTERVELLGSVVRSLGGGGTVALGYGEATGTDPWATNRRRYSNRSGHKHGPLENARTVRGASDKRNPRGSERERAVRTFRMWHEFAPHRITRMKGPDRVIPRTLVKLGDIRSIDYISDKYEGRPVTYTHKTDRPRPVLATDPDGRNLHIVGGRVKITADGLIH
jgi:hypothetical protein